MSQEIELGISIASQCYTCNLIGEACPECMDLKETNLTVLAHNLVDDGNVHYKRQWLRDNEAISAHEWIGSQTRRRDSSIREEFLEPTTQLADRPIEPGDDAMIDLVTVRPNEKVCNWCNLTFFSKQNNCTNCELADA